MPYCAILYCKNASRLKNLRNGGVSYHRFPNDGTMKEKWIDATGRINWFPTKLSTICSEHFEEDDFLISKKGYRYTKSTALPRLKIVKVYDNAQNINDTTAGPTKRQADLESSDFAEQPKTKIRRHECLVDTNKDEQLLLQKQDVVISLQPQSTDGIIQLERETVNNDATVSSGSEFSPRKKKLKAQLRFCEEIIKKQGLKIKRLQSRNRRMMKKISKIEDILTKLEEKFAMAKEDLNIYLKN